MSLKDKTILITGSTDGVGWVVAERLAAEGANVIVHGRDKARGDSRVEAIAKRGGKARFLRADLASLAEVRSLADAAPREFGGLDILVNNAGIGTAGGPARSAPMASSCASRSTISRGSSWRDSCCRSSKPARRRASSTSRRSDNSRSISPT